MAFRDEIKGDSESVPVQSSGNTLSTNTISIDDLIHKQTRQTKRYYSWRNCVDRKSSKPKQASVGRRRPSGTSGTSETSDSSETSETSFVRFREEPHSPLPPSNHSNHPNTPSNPTEHEFHPHSNVVTILDKSGKPITDKDTLILDLCLEIGILRDALEDKARQDEALHQELKLCRNSLKEEFRRTSYLTSQITALEELQKAAGKQKEALQFEIKEKIDGNHALLTEMRRLRGEMMQREKAVRVLKEENSLLIERLEGRSESRALIEEQAAKIKELEHSLRVCQSNSSSETDSEKRQMKEKAKELESELSQANSKLEQINNLLEQSNSQNETLEHEYAQQKRLLDSTNARCGDLQTQNDSLQTLNQENKTLHLQLETLQQSQSKQYQKLKKDYLQKEREVECSHVTIRKLKQQNEYLRQKEKEREGESVAYQRTIAALHSIISKQKASLERIVEGQLSKLDGAGRTGSTAYSESQDRSENFDAFTHPHRSHPIRQRLVHDKFGQCSLPGELDRRKQHDQRVGGVSDAPLVIECIDMGATDTEVSSLASCS